MGTTRAAPPSLCAAEGLEERCGRESGSRKTRVVRTVAIRDDRHLCVDVPSSIARMLFQSLEEKR